MEKPSDTNVMDSKVAKIVIGIGLLLVAPLIAMLFTDEIKWGVFDFVIIGALLMSASALYLYITTKLTPAYQTVATIIIVAVVMLIWGEMAVGIFGTPFAGS